MVVFIYFIVLIVEITFVVDVMNRAMDYHGMSLKTREVARQSIYSYEHDKIAFFIEQNWFNQFPKCSVVCF